MPWLVGLSAILFLVWFGLLIKERRPFARELEWFARQPLPKKCAAICLLCFFAWWGGAKEGGSGGEEPSRLENLAEILRPASLSPPLRNLPEEVVSSSNRFTITAFEVSQEEQTVAFETRWATNLFDYTDSGNLYLFMSTNLLEKRWTPLGLYEMPIDTNVCAFSIFEQDVETSARERFLDSFNGIGFYRFGIDFDSDGDGLADVIERLWHFTDPQNPDTDGDGLSDGEELSDDINTNPLVFDTDGDGIGDGDEMAAGSNPNKSHSDYDDLSDAQEIGTMNALPTEEFLWFDVSEGTDLIANYSTMDGRTWTIPLPVHPIINNVICTNAAVGVDGFVHLLCPTNPGSWKSTGYNYSGGLSNYQWSAVHTTVALCNANLYTKPPSSEWGSKILYGSVESEGRTFGVIEYRNIGLYATRASNELITCQLILPSDETNTVYVSYLCASNAFREVNLTVGVQCGGILSFKPGEKYYNLSWPLTEDFPSGGTTIKYTIGAWTDPAKTDTDGDGLSDSDEALVYGTDPLARDSDGDGALDGVELSLGTNPRNPDTDGDGIPDGWEVRYELDPLLIDAELDADADGLCNLDEYRAGTNPLLSDTDGDGLSDGEETGRWEYVSGLPAFNTSVGTYLLPSASSSDSGQFVVALPFVFKCAGYIHTNVTVCLDGVVALMSNRESSSFSVGYGNSKIENCTFSSYHTTIAAYWDDLYVKTNEGSQIRVADVTVGGKRYAVIEYDKIRLYSQQNDASATGTFQVILPESEADTVYVRYVDMSSAFNGSSASIGAQLPKKELLFDVAFNQAGSVTNGMTIAYRFGPGSDPLIADTDGDGLNDGDEFEQETSARFSDTDGDGLVDSWEIQNGLDPLSAIGSDGADGDPDGDKLSNSQECAYGTHPNLADSEGDGLSDGNETGSVFENNALPWLSFTTVEALTGEITNVYRRCVSRPMPQALTIQGETVTNLTISANGLLFLNKSGYANGGNSLNSSRFDYTVDKNALVIAPYLINAYYRSDVPGKESSVKLGTAIHQNETYLLVEYANIHETSSRYYTNSISFQVAIPLASPDRAYVRYKDLTGNYMDGEESSIGMQTFDGVWMHSYCYCEKGKVREGLSLEFLFGFNTDPLVADTDGDGLNDGYEVSIGTAPTTKDTDGDGLPDDWEVVANLDPLCVAGDDGALGDPDGDGLENRLEFERGTNPCMMDSDNDGLSDDAEVVALSWRNTLPWLETTEITNLTEAVVNSYRGIVDFKLPSPVLVQGKSVDSITIDRRGILYLNPSGYQNPMYVHSVYDLETTVVDANCFTIVPYFASLFLSDEPWPSVISVRTAEHGGRGYLVLECTNMYRTLTTSVTNAISFQVAFSSTGRVDRLHVAYADLVGTGMDGANAVIGAQSFGAKDFISYCEYESGKVHDGMGLTLVMGYGSNPLKADTDEDGLSDGTEVYVHGSSPVSLDSDADGLTDPEEVALGTGLGNSDTDGDGLLDGWEVANNLNPLSATGSDGAESDNDQDGLTNLQEQAAGTNPFAADTDGDGLGDAQELQLGTNVANADTDGDGLTDKQEVDANYDPIDPDMDRDGLIDGWEATHGLNPQSSAGDDGAAGDPDGDGLSNINEYQEGTDPRNSDTDGDGVSDGKEVTRGSDPTNPFDGGQAPAVDRFRTIQFNINGDYATWEMTIEGQGPDDTRTRKITMASPNAAATTDLRLRKGNSYRLSMRWLNCDGHNDDSAPWYCWQAKLDGLPSGQSFTSYTNTRLEGNELIFGDGWFTENADGLLTSHVHVCERRGDEFGGGNVAGSLKATLHVLDDPKLIPDYNRDGTINDADKDSAAQGNRLRFWINDDADSRATDGKYADSPNVDIPGAGSRRKPDWQDDEVNGWCDLLDFTPLGMDISALRVLPDAMREKLTFKIRHDEGSVNVVWTGLPKSSVGTFQNAAVDSCGRELDENSFEATTERLSSNGIEVPEKLVEELRKMSSDQGVFFLEGRSATQAPLKFDVYYEDKKLVTGELPLILSSVEEMYWFYSVRGAERTQSFPLPVSYTPGNLSDDLIAKTVFFTHGFNVDKDEARAWGSEVFKRLWQSGSNAKFKMVTWAGDYNWTGSWANGVHYHQDVYQALKSASAYKRLVEREEPASAQRILMAQSLGNMMTCEALRQGLTAGHYFMFDAAVASEALDASRQSNNADTNAKYIPSDWSAYPPLSFAANWHKWFKNDASDARGKMGWPDYFKTVLDNAAMVCNYYSSGDPVFMEKIPIPSLTTGLFHWPTLSWSWPFINLNLTEEVYSWQKQETRKGIDAIAGTLYGGWGFYCWTEMVGDVQSTEYYSVSEANALVSSGSITNTPVFSYSGTQMRNPNATQDDIWYALAKHVPAISSPVGGTTVDADPMGNFDLNTSKYRNGWGRNHRFYEDKWLHSDMKDMAFFYVYKLYNELIQKGGLK